MAMEVNWLRDAMADDNLVAELLLRLHRPDSRRLTPLPALGWGIRKRRSKATACFNKENERRSPTTPLSWTAVSLSLSPVDMDSSEESSRTLVLATRFKGSPTSDTTNLVGANNTSRRKRTFAELKEEESFLLKEREHLNKQMESLQLKLEEKRSLNESLKRVKLDMHARTATVKNQIRPSSNGGSEREASTSEEMSALDDDFSPVINGSSIVQPCIFVLRDLNMTPESIIEMS